MPSEQVEVDEKEASTKTPIWRVSLVILASCVAALAFSFLILTVMKQPQTKPSDVSAGTIFLYSLGVVVLLVVPWRDIGLVPKKIGEIEFDTVISTQKKEQIDANVALRTELDKLRARIAAIELSIQASGLSQPLVFPKIEEVDGARLAKLEDLIMRLLERHRGVFFSPLRLRNWGSEKTGFSDLAQYSKEEVTKALSDAVSKRGISVKVSRMGNSLYGLSKRRQA